MVSGESAGKNQLKKLSCLIHQMITDKYYTNYYRDELVYENQKLLDS